MLHITYVITQSPNISRIMQAPSKHIMQALYSQDQAVTSKVRTAHSVSQSESVSELSAAKATRRSLG